MAMYKIPQDVEADDKFLGPLSFKQFIFVGITAVAGYLSFLSLTKGFWPALIVLAPIMTIGGFLGYPWGRDQPTEIWLAARIRFFIKPRKRIWNQSGIKELVTITVPKKIEKVYTNGLSQVEVKSRLNGLATLLDSRGWAVKNVDTNVYANPLASQQTDDRLLGFAAAPVVQDTTVDVLDESSNSTALHFEEMIKNSQDKHRKEILSKLQDVRHEPVQTEQPQQPPVDFSFLNEQPLTPTAQPDPSYSTFTPAVVAPQSDTSYQIPEPVPAVSTEQEQALLQKIHSEQQNEVQQYSHLRTIQPIGMGTPTAAPQPQQQQAQTNVTTPVDPAIIQLANNNDLSVDTLARQVNKPDDMSSDGEVVISLR